MVNLISAAARVHLRWALTDGVGPLLFSRLVERFGGAEAALGASVARLCEVERVGRETGEKIARGVGASQAAAEAEIAEAERHGVRIVCREDAAYPAGLRRIPDPPIVLFVRGELRPTDALSVAIVGSRRCSIYGGEQARRFGELLAGAGLTVVSGLARGIDAFALHGAVDAGGRGVAVMGSGLAEVYPPENRPLAERLLACGAWLSELPIRSAVRAGNFPHRNRIIAGMTLGTIVVEAAARSGALITARLASEYNREVFAVPGRVQDPTSIGTNALIRDGGAKLVTCLEDVVNELGDAGRILAGAGRHRDAQADPPGSVAAPTPEDGDPRPGGEAPEDSSDAGAPAFDLGLSPTERAVYALIGVDPTAQDAVLRACDRPEGEALAAFTMLELKGLVRRLPGQRVARASRGAAGVRSG